MRTCQSPLEGAGIGRASDGGGPLGASHGARLARASSARTSHVGRGQPRWEATPGPTMHCVARHSERRVPARQVRPGPSFQPPRGLRDPCLAARAALGVSSRPDRYCPNRSWAAEAAELRRASVRVPGRCDLGLPAARTAVAVWPGLSQDGRPD